jgi:alkylresorcinol/alkylpyrone synthase
MSKLVSVGTSTPAYEYSQEEVKDFISHLFGESSGELSDVFTAFDNALVSRRFFSVPREWLYGEHTFSERNRVFQDVAYSISCKSIQDCIESSGAEYSEIDAIIFVSSTGISTPGIDASICNALGFRSDCKRIPVWGLGCAGGASGISLAMDLTRANPEQCVLLVSTELCSICFQKDDISKKNIIATSLFSDGSASALIAGNKHRLHQCEGIRLIDTHSVLFPDTLDVMGWKIIDSGLDVVISKDIPVIVYEHIGSICNSLLSAHELSSEDIRHFMLHPGGRKVLEASAAGLGRAESDFSYSFRVLEQYGNMSSATVLFVIKKFFKENTHNKNEFGIIAAFGPGFSAESILFST